MRAPLAGGLISCGVIFPGALTAAGRIPNGDTPADLPVQRSTNFDLMVNLKAAEVLDITVLSSILTCPRR
jgi:putative tryptophan/tyrosine transport system substrate-binding protein